jgi:hypothetical protein
MNKCEFGGGGVNSLFAPRPAGLLPSACDHLEKHRPKGGIYTPVLIDQL